MSPLSTALCLQLLESDYSFLQVKIQQSYKTTLDLVITDTACRTVPTEPATINMSMKYRTEERWAVGHIILSGGKTNIVIRRV